MPGMGRKVKREAGKFIVVLGYHISHCPVTGSWHEPLDEVGSIAAVPSARFAAETDRLAAEGVPARAAVMEFTAEL